MKYAIIVGLKDEDLCIDVNLETNNILFDKKNIDTYDDWDHVDTWRDFLQAGGKCDCSEGRVHCKSAVNLAALCKRFEILEDESLIEIKFIKESGVEIKHLPPHELIPFLFTFILSASECTKFAYHQWICGYLSHSPRFDKRELFFHFLTANILELAMSGMCGDILEEAKKGFIQDMNTLEGHTVKFFTFLKDKAHSHVLKDALDGMLTLIHEFKHNLDEYISHYQNDIYNSSRKMPSFQCDDQSTTIGRLLS